MYVYARSFKDTSSCRNTTLRVTVGYLTSDKLEEEEKINIHNGKAEGI